MNNPFTYKDIKWSMMDIVNPKEDEKSKLTNLGSTEGRK